MEGVMLIVSNQSGLRNTANKMQEAWKDIQKLILDINRMENKETLNQKKERLLMKQNEMQDVKITDEN